MLKFVRVLQKVQQIVNIYFVVTILWIFIEIEFLIGNLLDTENHNNLEFRITKFWNF